MCLCSTYFLGGWILIALVRYIPNPQMFSEFFMYFLKKQKQYNQIWFQQTFLYCMAWAFAATLSGTFTSLPHTVLLCILINNNINTSFSRCQETSRHLFAQAVERQQRGSTETEVVHTQPWPNVSRENVLYGLSL